MREAPSIQPRRALWQNLEGPILRDAIADALDQNDRDHLTLATEQRRTNALLLGVLVSTASASIMLAVNIALNAF